jgi:signal transduction histidine kinase/uncharacterized protein YdeI (BOF family)
MPTGDLNKWRTPSVLVVIFALLIAAGALPAADPAFPQQVLQTVTNVSQLYRLSQDKQRTICSVRLEGVVCEVTPAGDNMALRDGSGDLDVNIDLRGRSIQPGQKVLVEGTGIMNERGLSLQPVPLVDNDNIHGMGEVAGTISLKAGRHPIRLTWFQCDGPFGLEAYYAGPDLPHQRIPASALFREQVDPGKGNTNFVPGLNYRDFECATLFSLPEFNRLTSVSTGTVTNFDVSVISRSNNVALEFTGYVEVAREGLYTFSISSDDGSQLFIGEPAPLRLEVLGSVPLPAPHPVVAGQALSTEEDHWWSEVEGTVTFVSEQSDGLELELTSGVGHMRIRLAGDSSDAPVCLLNSQIRARGFCRSTSTSEGQKVAGLMTIASWKHIELVQLAAEYWTASPLAPVCGLLTNTLAWTNGAIVRVQGELRPEAPDQPRLQDETGKILVEGVQVSPEAFGARVELLGRLDRSGTHAVIRNGFYRQLVQSVGTNAQTLPLLTSAKQIQYLSATEANRNYPVRLRGVVTSSMNYSNSFVLQDATHGIWVNGMGPVTGRRLQIGEFVQLEGLTAAGDFAPTITATRVVPLGVGQMPEPIRPNRDQMINGSLDAQYVELQGVVTAVEPYFLTLLTPAGKFKVGLNETPATDWSRFENALVRIKGCCYASWDAQTHLIKIGETRVYNPSINVDEPAPADLFAAPVKTAAELLLFDAKASALKRIKVQGQVVHERAGEYYLMNGTNGLRVFPKAPVSLTLGDRVEVVGFPELGGASPVLREAIMRKTGAAPLPHAEPLTANTLLSADHDATLVQVVSQLVGMRSSQTEQVLELQTGARTYQARLNTRNGLAPQMALGSRLQLTGVYAGQGGDRAAGRSIDSFELLLNAPSDVKILERPSWWTIGHTLAVVGALVVVLLLSMAWIMGLRRQVNLRTRQLRDEIEEHKRTEIQLTKEIEARKQMEKEIEHVHRQLLDTSRRAGMAEIATNVLHNVGNVLNSVNVTTNLLAQRVRKSRVSSFPRVVALLQEHAHDLGAFITSDAKGKLVPTYLAKLSENLLAEQETTVGELDSLRRNVEHINEIVAMQQNYAKVGGVKEIINVVSLVEDSLRMNEGSLSRHHVEVVREFENVPTLNVDKHKLLQILMNLVRNAKQACQESGRADKRLTVRVANGDGRIKISVMDNGVGILPENLNRIFNHGFTTRKSGHGFGLHSGALAAKEMGGSLNVHSDGPGQGAAFTLELPCPKPGELA